MSKNAKKKSFKNKEKETLADYYTQSEVMALPELSYMKPVDAIAFLKQNGIVPLKLTSPFDGALVFLKKDINSFIGNQQEQI
jgi:hypothetical protein